MALTDVATDYRRLLLRAQLPAGRMRRIRLIQQGLALAKGRAPPNVRLSSPQRCIEPTQFSSRTGHGVSCPLAGTMGVDTCTVLTVVLLLTALLLTGRYLCRPCEPACVQSQVRLSVSECCCARSAGRRPAASLACLVVPFGSPTACFSHQPNDAPPQHMTL